MGRTSFVRGYVTQVKMLEIHYDTRFAAININRSMEIRFSMVCSIYWRLMHKRLRGFIPGVYLRGNSAAAHATARAVADRHWAFSAWNLLLLMLLKQLLQHDPSLANRV